MPEQAPFTRGWTAADTCPARRQGSGKPSRLEMRIPMELKAKRIRQILSVSGEKSDWRDDLERLERGDTTLTRQSAGESAI